MRRVVFSSVLDATVIRRSGPPPPAREALRRRSTRPFSTGTAPAPLDGPGCCTLLALATLRGRQAVESETTPRRSAARRAFRPRRSRSRPTGSARISSAARSAGPRLFQRLFRFTGSSFGSLARWHLCTYSHAATRRRKSKAANEPSGSSLHDVTLGCGVPPRAQACTRSVQYSFDRSQTPTADLTAGAGGLSCKGRVQGPPRGGSGERRRPHAASARACFCLEHGSCIIELRLCHTCVRLVVTKIRHAEGIHGLREVASVADHRRCCALRT